MVLKKEKMSGEEEQVAPRSRGRPKGVKDSKPRAPRRTKQTPEVPEPGGVEADVPPSESSVESIVEPSVEPDQAKCVIEPNVLIGPSVEPAPRAEPRRARRTDTPREEVAPAMEARKRNARTPRRAQASGGGARLERTPSPPLSYLEVLTHTMAAARHAERTERSARYDAFFAR